MSAAKLLVLYMPAAMLLLLLLNMPRVATPEQCGSGLIEGLQH
jgi:hypothetical protein